jgi:hypothetical protein
MSGASWDDCRKACEHLLGQLDWRALGEVYFDADGDKYWAELQPRVLEMGLEWARALTRRLPEEGTSLYAGAGVAELPVLLAEAMVRGRKVKAVNLRSAEVTALNDALRRTSLRKYVRFECEDAGAVAAGAVGTFDHLACVSLFTDPEVYPALSGVAYGRIAPLQLDVDRFVAERARAKVLSQQLFDSLRRPAWITTTAEEVAWFLACADAAGAPYEADPELIETAVVGDPIGFLRLD